MMKKRLLLSAVLILTALTTLTAQTMRVNVGDVTYAHPASQTGSMPFSAATTLTVQGKVYNIADITSIEIDNSAVTAASVTVDYAGNTAKVVVAGDVARYLEVAVTGSNVCILQDAALETPVTYTLSGSSENGSFYMDGDLKSTLVLNGLTLTSADSSAVKIRCGKRTEVKLVGDNVLTDAANDNHKGCLYLNGHSEWTGDGTLTITGNANHGVFADEFVKLSESFTGTITVTDAMTDGFHVNQYYEQKGGTVVISSRGDGIDVGLTGKKKTNEGQLIVSGGSLEVTSSGAACKALKCDSVMTFSGGTVKATSTGSSEYDTTDKDIKSSSAIKAGGSVVISGGTIEVVATGSGGRAITTDVDLEVSGGSLTAVTTGSVFTYGSSDNKANAVKADKNIVITGGRVFVAASPDKSQAFKPAKMLLLNGGTVMAIGAKESVPSLASTQAYARHMGVQIVAGSTLTLSGVSFTIPAIYSSNGAYVLVSSPEME